jgi:hypothetical protein
VWVSSSPFTWAYLKQNLERTYLSFTLNIFLLLNSYQIWAKKLKNQENQENRKKNNWKNRIVKKNRLNRLKFWKNRLVRFLFYKSKTEKPKLNRTQTEKTELNRKKTESNRFEPVFVLKHRAETGRLNWFRFFLKKNFSLIILF